MKRGWGEKKWASVTKSVKRNEKRNMITAVLEVSSQWLFIANVPESVKRGKHKLPVLYGTGTPFFTPFRLGTISQRWEVNKTLKNSVSQHSWVPGTLKRVYSRRFNAKTQTRVGINFVQWLQHRVDARWIGGSIPRRDKRCLLQPSNRPWNPQYRGNSLGIKRPARETDHYSTSSNNVKNVWEPYFHPLTRLYVVV